LRVKSDWYQNVRDRRAHRTQYFRVSAMLFGARAQCDNSSRFCGSILAQTRLFVDFFSWRHLFRFLFCDNCVRLPVAFYAPSTLINTSSCLLENLNNRIRILEQKKLEFVHFEERAISARLNLWLFICGDNPVCRVGALCIPFCALTNTPLCLLENNRIRILKKRNCAWHIAPVTL
jgi:hypothetical protein